MKKYLTIATVAVAVTLGGCHVFKQKPVAKPVAAEKAQIVSVAPTLQSLDARLTAVEQRNVRVDARAKVRAKAATQAQPYPYFVK